MKVRSKHVAKLAGAGFLAAPPSPEDPDSRQIEWGLPYFTGGVPISEVPLRSVAAIALLMGSYGHQNLRRAPQNAMGLGLAALSMVGVGRAAADVRATHEVMRRSLDEALGTTWQDRVQRPRWAAEQDQSNHDGLVRVARSRRRYTQLKDQHYGDAPSSVLDLWRHPDLPAGARAPIILQIPGGAWIMGSKRGQGYPLMNHLTQEGWICASMSYRLAPRHPWPSQIIDVKKAIAWLRAHAEEFGGDPDFIAVTGGSAGGHLASLAALSANEPAFQPGFEDADTAVAAAVPLYGRYDWLSREGEGRREFMYFLERVVVQRRAEISSDILAAASPILRDAAGAPPFLVIHGRNDSVIPVEQAHAFADHLREGGRSVVAYAELPGAQHGFDIVSSRRTRQVCEAIGDFLGVMLGEHRMQHAESQAR